MEWEQETSQAIPELDWVPGVGASHTNNSTGSSKKKKKKRRRCKIEPDEESDDQNVKTKDGQAEVKKLLAQLKENRLATQGEGMTSFALQSAGLQEVMTKIAVCSGEQGVPLRKLLLSLDSADGEADQRITLSELKEGLVVFGLTLTNR